jgi:hypothetical protein
MVSWLLVGTLVCTMGCSSSYQVSSSPNAEPSFTGFNVKAYERDAVIVFRDGREVEAKNIIASRDSTRFSLVTSDSITVVATQSIRKVVLTNHLTGFLDGFGLGALGGGLTVLVLNGIYGSNGGEFSGTDYKLFFIAAGAGLGGLIGGIPGLIIGHSDEYSFPAGADSTKR